MSKKLKQVLVILAVAIIVVLAARFLFGDEDIWICQDGYWVRHGNPASPMPETVCGN